jgi:hypothetical protein
MPNTQALKAAQPLMTMLGNPGRIMNPDIYSNVLPDKTQDGLSQYVVRLISNDSGNSIRGLLTENLSINTDATWDTIDLVAGLTTNPFLGTLYKYGTMIGGLSGIANVANTGISTRKIYTKSGYLELDIRFRVVDWQGVGSPVESAFLLTSMCLPKNLKNFNATDAVGAVADIGVTQINKIVTFITKALGSSQEDINAMTAEIEGGANSTKSFISAISKKLPIEGLEKLIPTPITNVFNDPQFLVIASAPSTITVQIGNYFKHNDMIVEGVKCEFSRQATSAGPLFADFSMRVSSRQAILMGITGAETDQDIGLMVGGRNRVSYDIEFNTPYR